MKFKGFGKSSESTGKIELPNETSSKSSSETGAPERKGVNIFDQHSEKFLVLHIFKSCPISRVLYSK